MYILNKLASSVFFSRGGVEIGLVKNWPLEGHGHFPMLFFIEN